MAIEGRSDAKAGGRIRLGMVGGGEGAFIGAVHRIASRIDDQYELVAGALSSTPEKARRSGEALGLAADHIYDDYESMAKAEAKRADGIEAVSIVTPNHMHAGPAIAFLKAGIHVICDKPLTVSLAEAKKMKAAVEKSGRIFALTHNYTGYPLVRRMREIVQGGDLGVIRLVQVEYPQDWLTGPTEKSGNKQAEWTQILTRGGPSSGEAAGRVTRVPPGHPEGYLEGFANIYSEVAAAIKAARNGKKPPKGVHFPTTDDGVKGLAFIEAAVKSSKANGKWVKP